MIKFFRKIRQGMLKENKIGKYFVYAAGEILLVVIGILIALQLNLMAENHKLDSSRQIYYEQILEDLQTDKIFIERMSVKMDSCQTLYNAFHKSFAKPNLTLDDMLAGMSQLVYVNYLLKFETNTVKTLENTGDIKLIPEKIRRKLLDLKQEQNLVIKVTTANSLKSIEASSQAGLLIGSPDLFAKQSNQRILAEYYNNPELKIKTIMALELGQIHKSTNEAYALEEFEEILLEIDTLIDLIEKEMNK